MEKTKLLVASIAHAGELAKGTTCEQGMDKEKMRPAHPEIWTRGSWLLDMFLERK